MFHESFLLFEEKLGNIIYYFQLINDKRKINEFDKDCDTLLFDNIFND